MTSPRDKRLTKSKVNQPPRGLQSLLGNVNQGVNPHELNHVIQPTTDLLPFWSVDKQKSESKITVVSTVLGGSTIVVPDGKLWRVRHIAGRTVTQSTDVLALEIEVWYKGTTLRVPLAYGPLFTSPQNGSELALSFSPGDLWYSGGTTFAVLFAVFLPASGTRSVTMTMDYTEISE